MNALIVYRSCYGSTRRYAEWISSALSANLCEEQYLRPEMIQSADIIIFGSGLYAGGVRATALLKRHAALLSGKVVVLFTVGLADPENEDNILHIHNGLQKALGAQLEKIKLFYFRGAMDFSNMRFFHKMGMRMMRSMLKKKKDRTAEDEALLHSFDHPVDFTDQKAILPLIAYCRAHTGR